MIEFYRTFNVLFLSNEAVHCQPNWLLKDFPSPNLPRSARLSEHTMAAILRFQYDL